LFIHVVRSGETLWQIANRYNVGMNGIIEGNGLQNPNQLVIGQSLVVPVPGTWHVIKSGDTLWSISQQYGVSINSIIQANHQSKCFISGNPTIDSVKNSRYPAGRNIMASGEPVRS
jgi:LysM repeat protein